MASGKQTVIAEIKSYVANHGGFYSEWYTGITADPRQRLFNDHAVNEKNGPWIYHQCETSAVAREVEDHFIGLGMKGGPGGGDHGSRSVYAYKITSTTKE